MALSRLDRETAARLASLVAIGGKSGDAVVGLSAVRRARNLAYLFVDVRIAGRTLRELAGRERDGTQVFLVDPLDLLARAFGREDLRVIGIRQGNLARGIAGRLRPPVRADRARSACTPASSVSWESDAFPRARPRGTRE